MKLKRWSSNQVLEYWKDVQDYEGLYMISSLGRVKSLERKVKRENGFRTIKEKILKPSIRKDGYLMVGLSKNGKEKKYLIHRLVAQAFIPNPKNKPFIDHIDTNKENNTINNLRWVSHKENCNNPLTLKKKSEVQKGKKLSEKTRKKQSKAHKKHYASLTEEERKEKHGHKGEKNPRARKVRCVETGEIFDCIKYASEWCGTSRSSIIQQIQGKYKSAGKHPVTKEKLTWEYIN